MATIRFASPETTEATIAADGVGAEAQEVLPQDAWRSTVRWYHPGSETELQMFEVYVPPNVESESHAHEEAEIIYVVEGELHFGNRIVGPGGSVFVDGNTLYGFRTGPEGVKFLNFRACQDLTYYSKEQFLARKAESRAAS